MLGKQKCKILKQIRQRIADENDIPYVTRECTHQGACRGTCPRCESELRYLEEQLALRASVGKRVAVAALCAGMVFSAAGCTPLEQRPSTDGDAPPVNRELEGEPMPVEFTPTGDMPYEETKQAAESETETESETDELALPGELPCEESETEPEDSTLMGRIFTEESRPDAPDLLGDVAVFPEEGYDD